MQGRADRDRQPQRLRSSSCAAEWNRAKRTDKPVALLVIDVDHFKKFNDCYGHLAGDACLQRVAASLSGIARRAGDFAARTGGEEFALLLPETNLDDAAEIAESVRTRDRSHEHRPQGSPEGRVTVSVGAAASRADRGDNLLGLDRSGRCRPLSGQARRPQLRRARLARRSRSPPGMKACRAAADCRSPFKSFDGIASQD